MEAREHFILGDDEFNREKGRREVHQISTRRSTFILFFLHIHLFTQNPIKWQWTYEFFFSLYSLKYSLLSIASLPKLSDASGVPSPHKRMPISP